MRNIGKKSENLMEMEVSMKLHKSLLIVAMALSQQAAYGWIATLKVMQHPDSKHVVRLAGDIHVDGAIQSLGLDGAMAQEKKFLQTIEQPLTDFVGMDPKEYECLVVEKTARDLLPSELLFQHVLSKGFIAAVPLFERINVLGHPKMSSSIKGKVCHIDSCTLKPRIEIVAYDMRAPYTKIFEKNVLTIQEAYEPFLKEIASHQNSFATDIKKQLSYTYHPRFKNHICSKGDALLKDLNRNTNKPGTLDLENFFSFTLADFGYLTYVAQNAHKNMTLYLGATHCENLAQDLQKMGYKTIFEKGVYDERKLSQGILPGPLSKKEYQEFFTSGRIKF